MCYKYIFLSLILSIQSIISSIEQKYIKRCANDNLYSSHNNNDLGTKPKHIAIGFFGISRNLTSTLNSIEHHVFNVLDKYNIHYDVFWNTMSANIVKNNRNGDTEYGYVDPFDARLIRPCKITITDQDTIKVNEFSAYLKARNIIDQKLPHIKRKYDIWEDHYVSIKNMLCALYTQVGLEEMIRTHANLHKFKYDAILVIRPDTAMLRDIDLPKHLEHMMNNDKSIWLPAFQHWFGYNDRAAFGSVHAMSIYLQRGIEYRNNDLRMTGEELVKYIINKYQLHVYDSDIRIVRVRQDGTVAHRDSLFSMNMTSDSYDVDYMRCIDNKTRSILPQC